MSNERHTTTQIPSLPIEYDLSSSQCYEKPNYTSHSHTMSAPYELGQYEVLNKQANENLKQQCDKAQHELNQLRRQYTETSRRCEHVMKVSTVIYFLFFYNITFRTYRMYKPGWAQQTSYDPSY